MLTKNIKRVLLAASVLFITGNAYAALDLPTIDNFVGSKGSAMEIIYGTASQKGLPNSSHGITLKKKNVGEITVEGFYKGNFDVDATYVLGKGGIKSGPYAARDLKPDGTPVDYKGKFLTVKRVLGINTSLGAFYFDIPDTLGIRTAAEALLDLSTTYGVNSYGGHDYTFKSMVIEGELLSKIMDILDSLKPSDNSSLTDQIKTAIIDAVAKNSEFTVGAMQLSVADDEAGTNAKTIATMEQYTLSAFDSNYTATETYYYGGLLSGITGNDASVERSYPVQFVMDEANNTFTLLNFADKGYAISHTVDNVTVENTDAEGNVTTSTKKVINTHFSPIRGTMDLNAGTFALEDRQQMEVDIKGYNNWTSWMNDFFIGEGLLYRYGKVLGVPSPDFTHPQVTGTINTTEGDMRHTGENLWHNSVNGGEMKTVVGSTREFIFDDYCTLWKRGTDLFDKDHYAYAKNLRVTVDGGERDVTHDVQFARHSNVADGTGFGVNVDSYHPTQLQVYGSINQGENADHVDHYEIYLHHKEVTKIDTGVLGIGGNYDSETGLKNSTFVGQVNVPATRTAGNIDYDFYVNKDNIKNNNSWQWGGTPAVDLNKDKFSVYVKTVYNNGLAPTFHALQTVQNDPNISTAIDSIETDSDSFTATGGYGNIVVSGNAPVEIYDMQGRHIYAGQPGTVNTAAGIYVVRCGGNSVKVVVK